MQKWFSIIITNHDGLRLLNPTPHDKIPLSCYSKYISLTNLPWQPNQTNLKTDNHYPQLDHTILFTSTGNSPEQNYFATEKPHWRTKHTLPFNLPFIWLSTFVRQISYYQHVRLVSHNFWLHTLHQHIIWHHSSSRAAPPNLPAI